MSQVVKQKVEMRNELLEAPIIKEGPNKGKPGSPALVENAPIVMDGPNRGKILDKCFISLSPGNKYNLPPGQYPFDKVSGDILSDEPVHAYRSNDMVTRTGQPAPTKTYFENPLGILERLQAAEAKLAALDVKETKPAPKNG